VYPYSSTTHILSSSSSTIFHPPPISHPLISHPPSVPPFTSAPLRSRHPPSCTQLLLLPASPSPYPCSLIVNWMLLPVFPFDSIHRSATLARVYVLRKPAISFLRSEWDYRRGVGIINLSEDVPGMFISTLLPARCISYISSKSPSILQRSLISWAQFSTVAPNEF
jgi:hypothetical protein